MGECSANFSTPPSCFNHSNATAFSVVQATVPNCQSGLWQPLTREWKALFYLHVALFGLLFLALGLGGLICLCKHHSVMRLRRMKTLIAVDVALVILGFSRALFYLLDPHGISGYCDALACLVVSQLLLALTFPSLTASYTLVFFTLWHVSTVKFGRSKVQRWKVLIPLCFVHYFVSVTVELIVAFSAYPAIFLLLSCQLVFVVWGLIVCATFLVVGLKILKSVKLTARRSAKVRRDTTLTRIPPKLAGQSCLSRIDTRTFDLPAVDDDSDPSGECITTDSHTDGTTAPGLNVSNGHSKPLSLVIKASNAHPKTPAVPVPESSPSPDSVVVATTDVVVMATAGGSVVQSVTTSASSEQASSRSLSDSVVTSPFGGEKNLAVSTAPHQPPSTKLKDFISKRHMQAIQKISIITYAVAVLGALYSILSLVLLGLMTAMLLGPCPEDQDRIESDPYVWLFFRYIFSAIELFLAVLLIYSVNEIRPVINMLRDVFCSVIKCRSVVQSYAIDGRKLMLSNGQFRSHSSPPQPLSEGRDFTISTRNRGDSPIDQENGRTLA